jgi:hypothetical protein
MDLPVIGCPQGAVQRSSDRPFPQPRSADNSQILVLLGDPRKH